MTDPTDRHPQRTQHVAQFRTSASATFLGPAAPEAAPAPGESSVAVQTAAPQGTAASQAVAESQAAAQSQAVGLARTVAATALELPPGPPPVHDGYQDPEDEATPRGRTRRLRIGSHLASRAALAQLGRTGPAAGLLLGIDNQRRPVTVRLFRPEPTRVAVVAGTWAAQLLAFRAFAIGARVVVVSDHPQHWLSFGQHATGRSDRLLAVAPESIASGASARAPTLIIDDRGQATTAYSAPLGPWQTQVTVLGELDASGVPLLYGCDLAVLQRLASDEATLATRALRLPTRSLESLQGIPDDVLALVAEGAERYVDVAQTELERSHVGSPNPRPIAPMPVITAAPKPAVLTPPPVAVVAAPPQTPPGPARPARPTPVAPPPLNQPTAPSQPTAPIQPSTPVQPTAPIQPVPPRQRAAPDWAPALPGIAVMRPGVTGAPVEPDEVPATALQERRRRGGRPVLVGIGVIAVLTLAGWLAGVLFTGATPTVSPSAGPNATPTPTPQQVFRPLAAPKITAAKEAGGVRFSWTYDDPAPGDFFWVQRTDVEAPEHVRLTEPTYLVADSSPCLQVQVFRANGQGGPPQVKCFP
jgi:hypothetical protein